MGLLKSIKKEVKRSGRKVEKTVNRTGDAMDEMGDSIERNLGLAPPNVDITFPKTKAAPIPDDEAARIARMRAYQRRYRSSGRQGTMLTRGTKLG